MTTLNTILNETLNATKKYNEVKKMWQYITEDNQIILTCKTEKGLDSNYSKMLNTLS